jgi:hypothetical protein
LHKPAVRTRGVLDGVFSTHADWTAWIHRIEELKARMREQWSTRWRTNKPDNTISQGFINILLQKAEIGLSDKDWYWFTSVSFLARIIQPIDYFSTQKVGLA